MTQSAETLDNLLNENSSAATRLFGTRLLAIDRACGEVRFSFHATPAFANVLGTVQGGIVSAMLDEASGLTARILSPEPISVPTLDFRLSFFAPVHFGVLLVTGRVVRSGRRVIFTEADALDDAGKLLARMNATSLRAG